MLLNPNHIIIYVKTSYFNTWINKLTCFLSHTHIYAQIIEILTETDSSIKLSFMLTFMLAVGKRVKREKAS